NIALLIWLGVIVLIVVDSIGLGLRLRKQLNERFPDEPKRGAVTFSVGAAFSVLARLRNTKPKGTG
ncbi:DUF3043 domain-containing protein, partial [Streptomyces clavuligerus]|uniref:DUF3043 domain-containing protein n=1 Tax=Streptomyces clavuligerus TaxID=1901 RepID=UPI0018D110F5